jgi:hypothetical protein
LSWRVTARLILGLILSTPSLADDTPGDPSHACDRAAARAEAKWHLPPGLLAAIGVVESGRGGLGSALPVAWPWTINAAGRGLSLASKAAAIAAVHAFQAAGERAIDIGCFQVDLLFHPDAFASLDGAFDPETNADAAAHILTRSRLNGTSWETAIALYHSASPVRGWQYFRQVQAVWPRAGMRSEQSLNGNYIALLSPAAAQVRVIVPLDVGAPQRTGVPRTLGPQISSSALQWTAERRQDLPMVLIPIEHAPHRRTAVY